MELEEIETRLIAHVGRAGYQPVKPKVLAKKLGLDRDAMPDLRRVLRRLVKQGRIAYGTNHLVRPLDVKVAQERQEGIVGTFRRTLSGFGFVRPRGAGATHDRKQDIFVSTGNAGDASTGDLVLVKVIRKRAPGRTNPEGRILEVVERDTQHFVGTYYEDRGRAFVKIDGQVFSQPILVGDPGAKNVQPGDKVVVELMRFPTHTADGEGVITEVLGPRGTPGVDTIAIIREYGLEDVFPSDAMDEAREQARQFEEQSAQGLPPERKDLRSWTIITIDPVDARDFDDAISLTIAPNGHWNLGVHIADVSHFVPFKSSLDREARERATSVYLPDRVLPMIPELISNGLASLQPGKERLAISAHLEFTAEGIPLECELAETVIKSCHRFTYEEVDEFLADPEAFRQRCTPEVHDLLGKMRDLARMQRQRRRIRGAIELEMPEVKIDLDKDGKVTGAHAVENTESHQMIEEFMLAANEAVAERLTAVGVLFLRRIHPSPDPKKLDALTDFVTGLGYETESLQSRFELQRILKLVAKTPQAHAINYAVLRSMARAVYGPEVIGHYALASENYCHFTSPIRRYPDLTIHRLVRALLRGTPPAGDETSLGILGEHCSQREQRAEEAERELTKVKLLTYLSERLGLELDAVITAVEDFGFFVQGIELPAEGLIHITTLADDFYDFERRDHSLTGRRSGQVYRLGDPVRVAVGHVDVDARSLEFRLVSRKPRPKPATFDEANPDPREARARTPKKGTFVGSKSKLELKSRRVKKKGAPKKGRGKGKRRK